MHSSQFFFYIFENLYKHLISFKPIKWSLFTNWGFLYDSVVKNLPANAEASEDGDLIPGSERSLEEEMEAHSSGQRPGMATILRVTESDTAKVT